MQRTSKITAKGQVTIPVEIRRRLRVDSGDRLVFEAEGAEVRVRAAERKSRFAKYRGIGNGKEGGGREAVIRLVRQLRGE
jgi:AbrB family looped-hinge helix DNA binding protein